MTDDLSEDATLELHRLSDIVAGMDLMLDKGWQYYAFPLGRLWLVFYNGPRQTH